MYIEGKFATLELAVFELDVFPLLAPIDGRRYVCIDETPGLTADALPSGRGHSVLVLCMASALYVPLPKSVSSHTC